MINSIIIIFIIDILLFLKSNKLSKSKDKTLTAKTIMANTSITFI